MSRALIFSDLHIGLKSDSLSRLNIVKNVISNIENSIEKYKINTIFFLGDLFHTRSSLNVNTINEAIDIVNKLANKVENFYLVVGNHDIYYKTDTKVNSLNIFSDIKNVHVIDKPKQLVYNNKNILLVPWLQDLSTYKDESFDILMGHFDIPSNYLIKSYIKNNIEDKTKASSEIISDILKNNILDLGSIPSIDDVEKCLNDTNNDESLGNFVNKAKKNGIIYSGHIHKRDIFTTHNRKFIFVGAPYEQTLGDINNTTGYIILDDNMTPRFVKIENIPTHYILYNSSILSKGIDKFDFSILKNKIVKRIIDIPGNRDEASRINIEIANSGLYEELPAEYDLKKTIDQTSETSELGEMIKKSKTDYIKKYINTIDKSVLEEKKINPDKLFELIESYITIIEEEKGLD